MDVLRGPICNWRTHSSRPRRTPAARSLVARKDPRAGIFTEDEQSPLLAASFRSFPSGFRRCKESRSLPSERSVDGTRARARTHTRSIPTRRGVKLGVITGLLINKITIVNCTI